jgi:predicted O-linked N-acetylglucosamine transferase (SPINDLY family)
MSAVPTIESAVAFWRAGRRREAELACRAALAAEPDSVDVLLLLGEIESACERHVDAIDAWRRVLERRPGDAATHRRLANSLTALGRTTQAIDVLRESLRLEPHNARALNNLGLALIEAGTPAAAIEYLEGALQSQPDYPIAYVNLGLAQLGLRDPSKALSAFDAAARLKPELARAHAGRGHALRRLDRPDAAVDAYERAIRLNPGDTESLRVAGLLSLSLNRNSRALQLLSASLDLAPDNVPALEGRAMALLGLRRFEAAVPALAQLMSVEPTIRYAPGHHFHAQLQSCDWTRHDTTAAALTQRVQLGEPVEIPWSFMAYNDSPADHLRCAQVFAADRFPPAESGDGAAQYTASAPTAPVFSADRFRPREAASTAGGSDYTASVSAPTAPVYTTSSSRKRIRLAYLSADFRDHAVAKLFARLAETHDRTRFEVTGVSFGPDDGSPMRARLQNSFDRFIDMQAMSDRAAAAQVRDLKIDIAVELTGFTSGCRLGILAARPAPIQVNYLGYPGTLGAPYVDYLIADPTVIPPHEHGHYAEKIITMPDCYLVNDDTRPIDSQTPTRAMAGLPEQGFVFCCFNNSFKITPGVFDLWMHILRRVPGSVLWLAAGSDLVVRNLRHEAERRQADPERLVFAPHLPRIEQHLARFGIADLFLDTLPYNAHATTCDALWAGLPVLTRLGSAFPGRVAASALQAVGLPELITGSAAGYVDLAVALGNDRRRVRDLRMRLNDLRPRAALFDTRRFRLHLEYAYAAIWDRHQRGESPAALAVPPLT